MNVIQQPNNDIIFLLGVNPYFKDKKYRLNKYCIVEELEDGTSLIFNTMTRAFVSLSNTEKDLIYIYGNDRFDFLLRNYFIVLEDYDEEAEFDKIRFKFANILDDRYFEERYNFLIVTTTGCNARCFYCYERKMSKTPMTLKTAEDVVQFILKKAKNPNQLIKLDWFGGEPLFNIKVIDYISQRLLDSGRRIMSSMISNGYLFDEDVVEKAVSLWNLNNVQITLDGTEEVYNKAKNYIYKNQDEVSPYKKVLNNIELLLNKNVQVNVRMNVDLYNSDNLKELVHELGGKFQNFSNFNTYIWPIFEDEDNVRDDENRQKVFDAIQEIESIMETYGWIRGGNLGPEIRSHHCMVDGGYNVIISTQGDLGLCEHFVDSDFFGSIYSDEINWDVIKSWREYSPKVEACHTCPRYPSCLRPVKCSDLKDCTPQFQQFELRHDRQSMRKTYNMWLERENQILQSRLNNNSNNNCSGGSCQTQPRENNNVIDLSKLSFKEKFKSLFNKKG